LVVSKQAFNKAGHSILAMITTKAHLGWPGDTEIDRYADAGLHMPCIVRLKIFTLDNRLILKRIGRLSTEDANEVNRSMDLNLV
jgi:mRNA interferase MazF